MKHARAVTVLLPSITLLCGAISAQGLDRIYALDRGTGAQPPKLHALSATGCTILRSCDLASPMTVHAAPRGGTAFDATFGQEWSSDGRDLVLTHTTCGQTCSFSIPATMADITGIGLNRPRGWIYTSHTDNAIRIWSDRDDCKPSLLGSCQVGNLVAGETVTGIEFDGRVDAAWPSGRLFCVTTRGYLIVLKEPTPGSCGEICRVTLPSCSSGRFLQYTGLTYDPGNRNLFVTDGKRIMTIHEERSCILTNVSCCTSCVVEKCYEYSGLGFSSGGIGLDPKSKPCTDKVCGCEPKIGSEGFPSVQNPGFRITLGNLPAAGVSVMLLGLGKPTSGLPLACGSVFVNPQPVLLTFTAKHGSGTGCSATASVGMGFFERSMVGLPLTVQSATLCAGGSAVGVALSAALTMEVGW